MIMDHFLVFAAICSLGTVYGGVVRRDAPDTQQIDSFQGLQVLASQFMSSFLPSQNTGSGGQSNVNPANGGFNGGAIESMFRGLSSNNGETMNYDLSEAMQMMNSSHGIPANSNVDTSNMTREEFLEYVQKQSKDFTNIINSEMTTILEPNLVVKFLNITTRASDPEITNNPEKLAALQAEYQTVMIEYQTKMHERLNGQKSSNSGAGSSALSLETLQKQMSAMSSMYNRELSQAMKPDDIAGALSGSEQNMNDFTQNVGKAVMNIFQSISQGPGPANQPLHWDSTKYN